jgi:ubiquinone/menaquinone biosynthesis C-methylase UbiE
MAGHVCPWWGGYFIDNRFRRLLHKPERILAPYVKPGMNVMDFGCGMGFFSIPAANIVGDDGCVVAVDVQKQMLDVLQKRAERAGVVHRIRTHPCQRDSIGVAGQYDFMFAFWSAHEVPSLRCLLSELRGCLAPGGKLLVAEPIGHVSGRAFSNMIDVAREVGLSPTEKPRIRLSRVVTFMEG